MMNTATNAKCILCGRETDLIRYPYLEVRTLPVRDFTKESKVQALGGRGECFVCESCADLRLQEIMEPGKILLKRIWAFLLILVLGIVILILSIGREHAFLVMGGGAVACGIMGIYARVKKAKEMQKEYQALTRKEALSRAGWEAALSVLPKKETDHDLSYLPITKRTLSMKNGDLMIAYDLLPAIAKQAWNVIHGKEEIPSGDK